MTLADSKKILQKKLVMEEIFIKGYEKVIKITNESVGLKAIIAIHDTNLGPALGGTRIYPYKNFQEALNDVLRLSKGMTHKAAVAEVGLGGGKSVIMLDPKNKTKEILYSFAEAVEKLNGGYICAEDVGCSTEDVMHIRKVTKYVTGLPHEKSSGDPGVYTAWGIYRGIQSVLKKTTGSSYVEGKKIVIQGLGNVGGYLTDFLFWNGADIYVSDINENLVQKFIKKYKVKTVPVEKVFSEKCDVFSPCAMGGIINDKTIEQFQAKAIAGSANNQLLSEEHGELLHKKGILYAPDFVINSGGLINVSFEIEKDGYNPRGPRDKTDKIYDVLTSIYDISEKKNISTSKAAYELAEYNVKNLIGKRDKKLYFHHSS